MNNYVHLFQALLNTAKQNDEKGLSDWWLEDAVETVMTIGKRHIDTSESPNTLKCLFVGYQKGIELTQENTKKLSKQRKD